MRQYIFRILIIIMIVSNVNATERFHQAIATFHEQNILNAEISVVDKDRLLFHEQIGFADIEKQQPFSHQMLFPIASLTKQFTAAAILILHDAGLCEFNVPIIYYLPREHAIWQGKVPAWANEITLHHLLTHTSGIQSYTELSWDNIETVEDEVILSTLLSSIAKRPLQFTPGKKFEYSNTGYLLLGVIVAELSKEKDFSAFLHHHIFKPLEMHNTFLPSVTKERELINNINQDNGFPKRYTAVLSNVNAIIMPVNKLRFKAPFGGGAGMISTAEDLIKWHQGLYQGRLLSARALQLMTTAHIQSNDPFFGPIKYGYGIFINDYDKNNVIYEHGGWIEGIRTELSYSLKRQRTVMILSNVSADEEQKETDLNHQTKKLHQLAQQLQGI
ncbi:MAG: hypothetical protein BGO43_14995 [Gammaproteobacteria bacterium 39-13]|nr:MAG: hypothetical protein BGO43_14995 [Gammaproteobacteria bacterium 39-13]